MLARYKVSWNTLAGNIHSAQLIHHGMQSWNEAQNFLIETLEKRPHDIRIRSMSTWVIVNNALITEIFILLCKIREENNSQASLFKLSEIAISNKVCDVDTVVKINNLLISTGEIYETIKLARGRYVAHNHDATETPYSILKKRGVTRADVNQYLMECFELLNLLGAPFNKSLQVISREKMDEIQVEMKSLFAYFVSIKQ